MPLIIVPSLLILFTTTTTTIVISFTISITQVSFPLLLLLLLPGRRLTRRLTWQTCSSFDMANLIFDILKVVLVQGPVSELLGFLRSNVPLRAH